MIDVPDVGQALEWYKSSVSRSSLDLKTMAKLNFGMLRFGARK